MREKLNNSPVAQIGLVAVLVVVAAILLLGGGFGGGGEEEASTETAATTEIEGAEVPIETAATVEGTLESFSQSTAASIVPPPLPKPVQKAYKDDKTVVLLVVHDGSIDAELVERSTRRVADRSSTALFVVPAKQIDRYAAITLGVDVQQLPALITVVPKRLDHGEPKAFLDYGFQSPERIDQAIRDAEYSGPEASYHPN